MPVDPMTELWSAAARRRFHFPRSGRTALCLLLTLLLPYIALAAQPASLLTNGSFEDGATGWQADSLLKQYGSLSAAPDPERPGRVAVLKNRSDKHLVAAAQTIAARPDKLYILTGWSRSTKLGESAGIAVIALDAEGRVLQRRWLHQIPSWGIGSWREFRGQYRPPKGTVRLRIALSLYKRGTVWLDALRLVATDPPRKADPWGTRLADAGIAVRRIPTKRPVYHLDAADLDGDGKPELLVGDLDGILRAQALDGRVVWERDLGGLALDIAHGDLDGDRRPEIAVATADVDGALRVFRPDGRPLWDHAVDGAVFGHAAVGGPAGRVYASYDNQLVAFSADGKVLWTRDFGGPRMRSIALDGGRVAVTLHAQKLFAAAFDAKGERRWLFQQAGLSRLHCEDLRVADLDGDGRNEVVVGADQGRVACIADGKLRWLATRERPKLWPKHRDATANLGTTICQIAVADFAPDRPGLETLVALIDGVWMLDRDGKFIWESPSGLLLLDLIPGPDGTLYAPSSGFRDPSIYELRFVRGKGNPLAEHRIANPIYETLEQTYEQIAKRPAAEAPEGKFHVIFANMPWVSAHPDTLARLRRYHETLKAKENGRLEFLFMLWPKDLPVELHRGQMTEPAEILEVVRFLERLGRPFLFFIDHGCSPNLSLATIEQTLKLAPKTCRGFYVAENTAHYPSRKWDDFVDWAMKVMDLCLAHGGKKMIFKEMFDAWAMVPADPRVRATLLQPKYRDIVVVLYATNNPHAPELQIGGMVGLKHCGMVSDWGISTQYWNWSWAEQVLSEHYPNICPADVLMRMELLAGCLGDRWFHIEGGQEYLLRGEGTLDPRAKRHRDLVYELIRKGLLAPVADADNLSFSPLIVARSHHPLVEAARRNGHRVGTPHGRPTGPLSSGLFGVTVSGQSVPSYYLPAIAYGVRRCCDTMAPATPFGYLRIVPDCPEAAPFLRGKPVLRTDGSQGLRRGEPISAAEARPVLRRQLTDAAKALPFRADGVCLAVHRLGDAHRVWLIDPGYLCPTGVDTDLEIRVPGARFSVTDLLTGEPLAAPDKRLPVRVPAGSFRLLEVRPAR